jgi:apolipoprotein N-acyltransferase
VLICYEDVLPELPARAAAGGADFLLVLSNENFYFAREMDQHLDMAVFRAIETRRPVLRTTNTGLTAAIDPTGAVVAALDRDVDGALDVDVRLLASPPAPRGTVGAFPLFCGIVLAAMLFVAPGRARAP